MLTTMTRSRKVPHYEKTRRIVSAPSEKILSQYKTPTLFSLSQPVVFSFALLGNAKAGKTSLAKRLCNEDFCAHYVPTNICQLHETKRPLGLGHATAIFHLWELTNSHFQNEEEDIELSSVAHMVLKKCTSIFYVYDCSLPNGLEKATSVCLKLAQDTNFNIQSIILIGNKKELIDTHEDPEILLQVQENAKESIQKLRADLQLLGKKIAVDVIMLSCNTSEKQEINRVLTEAIGPSFISTFNRSPHNHFSSPLPKGTQNAHSFSQNRHSSFFSFHDDIEQPLSIKTTCNAIPEISEKKNQTFSSKLNSKSMKSSFWIPAETLGASLHAFIKVIMTIFLFIPMYAGELFISFFKDATQQTEKEKTNCVMAFK